VDAVWLRVPSDSMPIVGFSTPQSSDPDIDERIGMNVVVELEALRKVNAAAFRIGTWRPPFEGIVGSAIGASGQDYRIVADADAQPGGGPQVVGRCRRLAGTRRDRSVRE
jgi:hypothetical protein